MSSSPISLLGLYFNEIQTWPQDVRQHIIQLWDLELLLLHFATYNNNDHHRCAIISLRFLSVDDTNATRIVEQNDACFNCSRKWHQWNAHPFSNTSFHECAKRGKADCRRIVMAHFFLFHREEKNVWDWMQRVVGFYFRWCWVSSRQK